MFRFQKPVFYKYGQNSLYKMFIREVSVQEHFFPEKPMCHDTILQLPFYRVPTGLNAFRKQQS